MRLQSNYKVNIKAVANQYKPQKITLNEIIIVLLLISIVLAINIVTSAHFPTVWLDEVMLTDPGANLYFGHGFNSTSWPLQTKEQFWAGNVPLHSFLLSYWLKLIGFSLTTVRAFNYVFMVATAIITWVAVVRLNLVTSVQSRITLIAFLLLGYGVSLNFHQARYDALNIFLAATTLLIYSLSSTWLRCLLLSVVGIFLSLSGLHLVPFTLIVGCLLLIFLGTSFFKEFVSIVTGLTIGLIFLYILYSTNGVWDSFMASVQSMKAMPYMRLPKDPSLILLFIAALGVAFYQGRTGALKLRSPLIFGITVSLAVAIGMRILGRFPTYYAWMAFIPLAICFCSAISPLKFKVRNPIHFLAIGSLVLACLIGWPLQMASTAYFWQDRDYAAVEALAARNITKNDWVYAEYSAYYAAKPKADLVILPYYLNVISPEEKEKISTLIIPPFFLDNVSKTLGGKWTSTGDSIAPSNKGLFIFKNNFGDKLVGKYNLEVFRRTN